MALRLGAGIANFGLLNGVLGVQQLQQVGFTCLIAYLL